MANIVVNSSDVSTPICFQKIKELKWIDAALITGCVALMIIGILASTGMFDSIGTTNAAYVSYALYGTSALCLIAELIILAVRCSRKEIDSNESFLKKSINEQIRTIEFSGNWTESYPIRGSCTITFSNGMTQGMNVDGYQAQALISSVDRSKCFYPNSNRHPSESVQEYTNNNPDTAQAVLAPVYKKLFKTSL